MSKTISINFSLQPPLPRKCWLRWFGHVQWIIVVTIKRISNIELPATMRWWQMLRKYQTYKGNFTRHAAPPNSEFTFFTPILNISGGGIQNPNISETNMNKKASLWSYFPVPFRTNHHIQFIQWKSVHVKRFKLSYPVVEDTSIHTNDWI